MQFILTLMFAALFLSACGQQAPSVSETKYDSAHSIALDGTIGNGRLITAASTDERAIREVKEQLMFTIGQFNGRNGVADMSRLQVTILSKAARQDGRFDVSYSAKLLVSWPREVAVPVSLGLIMPAVGDWSGLYAFYQQFGADESAQKLCLAPEAHGVSSGIFWYYYRPEKLSCPLFRAGGVSEDIVARFPITFTVSGENTRNKFPEYGKVWEDGRLVVTAIFGKNDFGATTNYDPGIAAYRSLYTDLINAYGRPTSSNLPRDVYPDAEHDVVELQFATAQGLLDVNLLLVDEIKSVSADFKARYNARTAISDFVSYSGHSGLGANIRALANMGQFTTGHYQIYMVNGCDTFAYVDNALRDAHQAVNPGFGPDKYFDIITNSMPSYFHQNARSNMAVINGLITQQWTYQQILSMFDQLQRSVVTGEQDNRWPLAFNE